MEMNFGNPNTNLMIKDGPHFVVMKMQIKASVEEYCTSFRMAKVHDTDNAMLLYDMVAMGLQPLPVGM